MVTGRGKLSRAFSPSLEDCPGAPNNRWPWASAALPACGQACARSRPGGAGSVGGCYRRSWLAVSNSERKDEAPSLHFWPGPHSASSASCPGEWQEALSLPHPRPNTPWSLKTPSGTCSSTPKICSSLPRKKTPATRGYVLAGVRSLCAVGTSHIVGRSDQGSLRSRPKILSVHAKDLFIAAMDGKRPRPLKRPGQVKQSGSKVQFGPSRSARHRAEHFLSVKWRRRHPETCQIVPKSYSPLHRSLQIGKGRLQILGLAGGLRRPDQRQPGAAAAKRWWTRLIPVR